MTPSIPVTLCDPFEGARLLCTAPITGIFGAPVPANARLIAGEIGSTERRRFLTVTGRSPLGMAVEVNVWEEDWDRLILLLDSPLALCHAARWLAQRRGHPPGSTAPEWSVEWDSDGAPCWRLRSGDEADWFPTVDTDLTDAEALAAACVAVGGAS